MAGAVASSAPVQAVVNFDGYNNVVAASLNNTSVGGSPQVSSLEMKLNHLKSFLNVKWNKNIIIKRVIASNDVDLINTSLHHIVRPDTTMVLLKSLTAGAGMG